MPGPNDRAATWTVSSPAEMHRRLDGGSLHRLHGLNAARGQGRGVEPHPDHDLGRSAGRCGGSTSCPGSPRSTSRVVVSMIAVSPTSSGRGRTGSEATRPTSGRVDCRAEAGADDLLQEERLGDGLLGEDVGGTSAAPRWPWRAMVRTVCRVIWRSASTSTVMCSVMSCSSWPASARPSSRRASRTGTSAGAAPPSATWGSGGPGRRDGPMRPCRCRGRGRAGPQSR